MEFVMAPQTAWIEKRLSERVESRLRVRYMAIPSAQADRMLESQQYKDIIAYAVARPSREAQSFVMNSVTKNISAGGMQILLERPMLQGQTLCVEVDIQGIPHPVRTLAVAVRDAFQQEDGMYSVGLRFLGISREDVSKVEQHVAKVKVSFDRELMAA
jgi:c-di-GMP-binding flagellar brake protein YcgR